MDNLYYFQPRYFEKFACIADKCVENCCRYWRIDWFSHEYEKIMNSECSAGLREKINDAFEPSTKAGRMKIKLNDKGFCPMVTDEGLCGIQKELGHEYLSMICQKHPRHEWRHKDRIIRCCAASCPAVIELLLNDERAMETELAPARGVDESFVLNGDLQPDIDKYPKLFFRLELLSFFTEILSNKRRPVETSIILGALAAKKISDIAEAGRVTEIPKLLGELKGQLNSRVTEKSVEEIKPNYNVKLKIVNNIIVKFFGDKDTAIDLSPLYENDGMSEEKYLRGLGNMRNVLGGNDQAFRNLAVNSFMQMNMPLYIRDKSIFENYIYFASICAVYRMVEAVTGLYDGDIRDEFVKRISHFNRRAEHNPETAENIMNDMNSLGFTSAAHLALIIK